MLNADTATNQCVILAQKGDQFSPSYELQCQRCKGVFRAPQSDTPCPLCLARTQSESERDEEPTLSEKGIELIIPHTSFTQEDRVVIEPQINLTVARPQRERAQRNREGKATTKVEEAKPSEGVPDTAVWEEWENLFQEQEELLDRLGDVHKRLAELTETLW